MHMLDEVVNDIASQVKRGQQVLLGESQAMWMILNPEQLITVGVITIMGECRVPVWLELFLHQI